VQDELTVRSINLFLGTNYTVEQVDEMPALWIDKMLLLIGNMPNG
jgi:hypothetical protein